MSPVATALTPDPEAPHSLVTHSAPGGGHAAPVTPPRGPCEAAATPRAALVHSGALLVLGVHTRQPALAQNLKNKLN